MIIPTSAKIWSRLAAVAAVVLLLGACENVRTDRDIAYERAGAYLAKHPGTSPEISRAMRNMDLAKDMTPAQVRATWGDPVNISPSLRGVTDTWFFDCEYPHICRGAGRRGKRFNEDLRNTARAIFSNGKLIEWRR